MYIIVNENPYGWAETSVCSPILKTWQEALETLAELRSECKNPDLRIYDVWPCATKADSLTVSFDTEEWCWRAGAIPGLPQYLLRDVHTVDTWVLDKEEAGE